MGVAITNGTTFLGVPLTKVRNVLRAWHRGDRSDVWRIADLKNVDLDPRTVMVLLEELRDRGLIGPEEQEYGAPVDGLTDAGLALSGADARARTPKDKARRILDRFLDACAAVNARNDLPFAIREVWLFGSMLDPGKVDVGDVDLVVDRGRPAAFEGSLVERYRELAREMGAGDSRGIFCGYGDQGFVERQLLHDGRRHPILSISTTLDDLRDMACPCQRVFDASRGGRVTEPVLPRHPNSAGRSNRFGEKRRMPDLRALRQSIQPVSAGLIARRWLSWRQETSLSPWPEDHPRRTIFAHNQSNAPVIIVDGTTPKRLKANVLMKRISFAHCDGCRRFGMIMTERVYPDPERQFVSYERPTSALIVEREIKKEGPSTVYRLLITDAAHVGRYVDFSDFLVAEWWLHLVISTDVERILRRDLEAGISREVVVDTLVQSDKSLAGALAQSSLFERPFVDEARARLGLSIQACSQPPFELVVATA
ncbi:hypothetical protein J2X36_003713 [Methylobacterium sp. BE186]|uniref:hypothetical protein n=1 Tax=Methylobacterium sp. BE186 TaxID=2817715 RepID=UPI00285FA0C4|nr:hypothetical protein [Methylobacterium sp. BE186]MDR7038941.1 hypothetical protein [Methylobacterium sp. BE186]